MLTILRRSMLREIIVGKMAEEGLPFSLALALQCFTNEYVFVETNKEKALVELLEKRIATLLNCKQNVSSQLIATLGAYRSLGSFSWAQELCDGGMMRDIKQVMERQILEPKKEQSLRSLIPRLTSIENTISVLVREQYEENPYPRWIKTGLRYKGDSIGAVLRGAPLCFELENYDSPLFPQILVAGCGTGQHALYIASRFSNARILAFDLSLNSLSYAQRKTQELDFSNIEYVQADIMELENLDRRFDLIDCSGVLHHLGDPLAGWRVLLRLLRPGGLMHIGLYSEIARQHIISGRHLVAEQGYTASPKDIRRCRQDIIAQAEDGNRKMMQICNSRAFFSLSECRDLLFHVQEHRFTLPQIEAALKTLKLEFLGFEIRDQDILNKFKKSHPDKSHLSMLPLWHQFELDNPNTFGGMYQFWCRKA
jgi:SAM-dependent methyltransferase